MLNLKTLVKIIKIFFSIEFLLFTLATDAEASHHAVNQSCIEVPNPPYPSLLNCVSVSWTEAFDEMHAKISKEYAFTDWRGIDWQTLNSTFRPLIVAAEASHDEAAYYQALREYFLSIHDGHMLISPPDVDERSKAFVIEQLSANAGGDYGLIITKTSDAGYVVSYIASSGSAEAAGIHVGDEIVSWNNLPIAQAIANKSVTWANELLTTTSGFLGTMYNPSTQAGKLYEQTRFLTRDIIGAHASVTVFRISTGETIIANLSALDDQMQTLARTNLYAGIDLTKVVTYKILPSGFGYLKITEELSDSTELADVQAAVTLFVNSHVPGIIIDVRGNIGGDDQMAASIAGFFYTAQKKLYESTDLYNIRTGQFDLHDDPVYVTPATLNYQDQIIILTNLGTISSGEGVPMALKGQSNIHILSFDSNTQGAFGIVSTLVILSGNAPGNPEKLYSVAYPYGRSLDKNNRIQVDANALLQGGVATDVMIPMTAATAIDTYTNGNDTAVAYAVNCLQTSCWASQSSSGSLFPNWKIIATVVAGAAAIAGGVYLVKQHDAINTSDAQMDTSSVS